MAKRKNNKPEAAPACTPREIHEALTRNPFSPEQQEVLSLLRWGHSIKDAVDAIGYSRSAFNRWCDRNGLFRLAAATARDRYTDDLADAFHQSEGYARGLIDMTQRNEAAPLNLRVRCSLSLVRRDPSRKWLPPSLDPPDPHKLRFEDFFPHDLLYPQRNEDRTPEEYRETEQRRLAERKELEQPRTTASEQNPSLQRRGPAPASTKTNRHSRQSIPAKESVGTSTARPPKTHAALRDARATQHAALKAPSKKSPENTGCTNQDPAPTPVQNLPAEHVATDQAHATATAPDAHNMRTSPSRTTESTSAQNTTKNAPKISEFTHTKSLDAVFLNHYTVHRHESAADFAKLHAEMIHAYQPATPREELTVLRIAQKHWALRRIDTFEMAISESVFTATRQDYPEVNGHVAIALKFLGEQKSTELYFFERMRAFQKHHENSLEKLDNLYARIQHQRIATEAHTKGTQPRYESLSPIQKLEAASQGRT